LNTSIINEIDINFINEYIFVCFSNGGICVLDLEKLGREKFIKEIKNFEGSRRLRTLKNISSDNQLITGDEKGFIAIWNLQTGEAINVIPAHDSAVTKIVWDEKDKILFSGSKDKSIKLYKLPERWKSKELETFEKNELKV